MHRPRSRSIGPSYRQIDIVVAPGAASIPREHHQPSGQSGKPLSTGPARLTPLRELQLLESYRSGGQQAHEALSVLLSAYQRRIYSICYRMVRDSDQASDLTQDALVKVLEGLETYDGRSKLSTWVIRVTMNCVLSHIRKQKVREHDSLDAPRHAGGGGESSGSAASSAGRGVQQGNGGEFESSGAAAAARRSQYRGSGTREPQPSESVQHAQMRAMIAQALDSLDMDTRAILVLRDLQDLDYQQLAEVLDVPLGTVKSRLFRARAALREAVEERERTSNH